MPFELPALPYAKDALAPHISAETLEFHHGKHHKAYVDNLNRMVTDTPMDSMPLEEVIKAASKDAAKAGIFNNAAQVWNHSFYWQCMKPGGGGKPNGAISRKIASDLGSYDKFLAAFKDAAATQFGSGWAWLVLDGGKLAVVKTANADVPLVRGQTPLLTIDVWEHAYYIDFRNLRPKYIETFMDSLVNWDFVNANLEKAG
ncbi:MAG: superoxide dismutase [Alphaproteobacteria bacterium]|nr:superoxide dismutase [Alphaproteobacteria bacterium]